MGVGSFEKKLKRWVKYEKKNPRVHNVGFQLGLLTFVIEHPGFPQLIFIFSFKSHCELNDFKAETLPWNFVEWTHLFNSAIQLPEVSVCIVQCLCLSSKAERQLDLYEAERLLHHNAPRLRLRLRLVFFAGGECGCARTVKGLQRNPSTRSAGWGDKNRGILSDAGDQRVGPPWTAASFRVTWWHYVLFNTSFFTGVTQWKLRRNTSDYFYTKKINLLYNGFYFWRELVVIDIMFLNLFISAIPQGSST